MKQILEDSIEQIKGPQQQKPKVTTNLKGQLDPGKIVSEAWKQVLGPGPGKSTPEQTSKEDEKQISQVRANIELLKPPKPRQQEVPEEQKREENAKKNKLPELVQPSSKVKRGDLYGANRKKTSIENKSGYQG